MDNIPILPPWRCDLTPATQTSIFTAWRDALSPERWDFFATLTFKHHLVDQSRATRAFTDWIYVWRERTAQFRQQLRKEVSLSGTGRPRMRLRGPVGSAINKKHPSVQPTYVLSPEEKPGIGWHLHALIRCPVGLSAWDPAVGRALWKRSRYQGGLSLGYSTDVGAVRTHEGAIRYVVKEAVLGNVIVSRNFKFSA